MPSKRTNDSVDRILQDLNRQQTAAGVQDSVTDHQVDEILRSVGIPTVSLHGTPEEDHRIAFSGLEDLDGSDNWHSVAPVQQPRPSAAPATPPRTQPQVAARPASAQPAPTARRTTAQPAPVQQPVAPEVQPQSAGDTGTLGDTTRTGIIKGFLLKMAPEAGADTDALNQGKNQFQKFFRDSVAVVPDADGKIREPGKKKRGLFGLKSADDTDEFVPINVSLGGGASQPRQDHSAPVAQPEPVQQPVQQAVPAPQEEAEEYFPDRVEQLEQQEVHIPPRHGKKQGLFGGLFGGHDASVTEEIVIPQERQEEPAQEVQRTPQAARLPEPEGDTVEMVRHSKYTRQKMEAWRPRPAPGDTMQMLHDIKKVVQETDKAVAKDPAPTSTIYRKKRNTVEFTPGQKVRTAPPAQVVPDTPVGEPVGEPIHLPQKQPQASGFTMQLGALDAAPLDSTQDFMAAYNAVRPRQETPARNAQPAQQPAARETQPTQQPPARSAAPAARPQEQPAPQTARPAQQAPQTAQPAPAGGRDPYADTLVVGLPREESLFSHREPDEVDRLVDTLTGKTSLTPGGHSGFTQDLGLGQPTAPAHSGFTQDLGVGQPTVPAHSGFTQDLGGGQPAAPAHSGFTQNLESGQPSTSSGFTQNLNGAQPPEPSTASFVQGVAQAINTGMMPGDTARFDTAAARLTQSLQDEAEKEPKLKQGVRGKLPLRFGGKPDDEGKGAASQPFETTEIPPLTHRHEYERAEDAPLVRRELNQQVLYYSTATMITAVLTAVLLVLGLVAASPTVTGPLADPTVYPAIVLVLLLVAGGICWRTVVNGLLGLAKRPTPDSLSVLPLLGAVLQCAVLLAAQLYTGDTMLLAGPAVLVLCMNTVGKRMNARTVQENFRLVSAKVDHSVAYRLRDAGALRAVSTGLAEPHPNVLINRPTQIFRSFLTNSAAPGTSDKNQQQFAWLAGGCALVSALFTLIRTQDVAMALTVLAGVLCLAAPLAGTLLSALPARMMQRSAAQVGAVIPGWRDIRQLGRINVIQVTARDLFPNGCVTLSGIKPVKPEHIDLAIVYAASILAEAGPILRDVFLGMLGENKNLLAQVDDRETIYGKGYVGWINKRRVLVGNRALMQDYGVKIPSLEYEQHHTVNQRRVIYLAVSGKMFAMFQVAYQRDPDTAVVLESLRRTGLSLVVDCDDFSCDVQLLETAYSLPAGSVKVLNAEERKALNPAVAWLPESEGNMLHLGSFASFVGGLEAAAGAAEGERRSSVLVSAAALLGCAVGVLFTLTGGLTSLPLLGMVLYQAAWCVLALIFPLIQRY